MNGQISIHTYPHNFLGLWWAIKIRYLGELLSCLERSKRKVIHWARFSQPPAQFVCVYSHQKVTNSNHILIILTEGLLMDRISPLLVIG
jgi:predicted glycosyl hydrolase (DUF1957 family)